MRCSEPCGGYTEVRKFTLLDLYVGYAYVEGSPDGVSSMGMFNPFIT